MDSNTTEHLNNNQASATSQEKSNNEPAVENSSKLEKELADCRIECDVWKDKYLRLSSDFQNFNRRLEKEQINLKRSMQADILLDILAIADNFDRAAHDMRLLETNEIKNWQEGLTLIRKQLQKFFEKYGVKPMQQYDVFDPQLHEAVMHVQSDKHTSGQIVQVLEQGYMLDGSVLRAAKVSIAQ